MASAAVHGGAMAGSSDLAARTLGGTKSHGIWLRRTRGKSGSHLREELERKMAQFTGLSAAVRHHSCGGYCAQRAEQREGKSGIGSGERWLGHWSSKGEQGAGKRGFQRSSWGKWERGAASVGGFGCRGREGRRRLWKEGEEAGVRAPCVRGRREERRAEREPWAERRPGRNVRERERE